MMNANSNEEMVESSASDSETVARRGRFCVCGHEFELRFWTPADWEQEANRPTEEETMLLSDDSGFAAIIHLEDPA